MPLFKKHNKQTDTNSAGRDAASAEHRHGHGSNQDPALNARTGVNDGPTSNNWGPATGAGTGAGMGAGTGAGAGYNASAGGPGATGNYPPNQGGNWNNAASGPPGHDSAYGAGAGPNGPSIPPTGAVNPSQNTQGSGGGRLTGKVEHAVGSMVGSQALQAKGLQKEQEAESFKAQSAELAEAERLEREALLRRERAVGHAGAHPSNKHLGGPQNADQNAQGTGY
ncbi:hypothetical protein CERSUDRAFT_124839 [Gelatoporia subvermispora B]|uniref:Uncharacterized protein n=1 Tax=Ceriporiopsis subvermispora (strain B) TaxID=914234 RepID=M2RAX1_CERS8|nr:hypothetical protein CERSUDRAFT_124839 [Gelatoporia subvermispora B]